MTETPSEAHETPSCLNEAPSYLRETPSKHIQFSFDALIAYLYRMKHLAIEMLENPSLRFIL